MKLQQRWAVAVLAAMAIFVSNAGAEIVPGKASFGGQIGVPFFTGDSDLKEGQSPRLIGLANFQYVFSTTWRLSTSFGYGWVGYKEGTPSPYPMYDPETGDSVTVRDEVLSKIVPVNVTMIRAFGEQGEGFSPYIGAGLGMTRLEIVNDRQKIKDPATFDAQATWQPGAHALGGVEYTLPSNTDVTFDLSARWTQLLTRDEESFPSGFTGKHSYFNITFGVNIYFWPIGYKPVETATAPAPDSLATPPAAPESAPPPPPAPAPAPAPAPPDTTRTPAPPDTSSQAPVPSEPKSAPGAMIGAAQSSAPSTSPSNTAPPAAAIELDDEAAEECSARDLRPMLGVPPRLDPAETPREP